MKKGLSEHGGRKAVVVGAGIAGIASAIRLAVKGFQVDVFESNTYPGGKLSEFSINGFRFDAGPSLFTMPHLVDELFSLAGQKASAHFSYQRLDPVCSYFYEDGTIMKAWADPLKLAEEIGSKTTDSQESVLEFLRKSAKIYDVTHHVFLERSLHRLQTYLQADTLSSILRLPQIDPFRTMNDAISASFKDSRTIRLFNRYATYNGSDPYRAPATLNIIPHIEYSMGAYFPRGGMYTITAALVKLAESLGVVFHYGTPVDEILVSGNRVHGVMASGLSVPAEVVLSDTDVWFTYHKLLKQQKTPARILRQERSSSALIFYWGIRTTFGQLGLHNILFSEDYRKEFQCLWNEQSVFQDPTVYVNISSKYNAEDAPEGCENWFVMINVPSNQGQDWDLLIKRARKNIIDKINRVLHTSIEPLIVAESVMDPRSIESRTGSYQGALYGTSSNSRFSAFLRHPNFSNCVHGLYFTGGSVHPGGGIPLALLSAKISVDLIPD